MIKKDQPDAEMVKGTLDMMILRTLVTGMRTDTRSLKLSSALQKTFWKLSKGHFTQLCIGLRIADGYLLTGERARTTAKRSFTG